jgi:hypothetical protein
MSLFYTLRATRTPFALHRLLSTSTSTLHLPLQTYTPPHRTYASKAKSTASFVPGSLQPLASEASRQEYTKAEEKMTVALDWFSRECNMIEMRCSGRVTPALLDPVRVVLPGAPNESVGLEELATVGVRDGSTLLVTVFDDHVCSYPSHLSTTYRYSRTSRLRNTLKLRFMRPSCLGSFPKRWTAEP